MKPVSRLEQTLLIFGVVACFIWGGFVLHMHQVDMRARRGVEKSKFNYEVQYPEPNFVADQRNHPKWNGSANTSAGEQSTSLKGLSLLSPDMTLPLVSIPLNVFQTPNRAEPTAARGNCNVPGVSMGQWHRFAVVFPDDNAQSTLYRLSVGARPIKALVP